MISIANTKISIYSGTTTDEFDDVVDVDTPIETDIPASIMEGKPQVQTGADGTPRVIRMAVLRVRRNTNIVRGKRIKDQTTGQFYIIDSNVKVSNLAFPTDLRVDLRFQQ